MRRFLTASAGAVICLGSTFGAALSEGEILRAAAAFVAEDAVGRAVLKGRTVLGAATRGSLWVVRLAPSGSIVMSGSDTLDPIVSFSAGDFAEPGHGSSARSLLASAAAVAKEMERLCGDLRRHERWERLLSAGTAGAAEAHGRRGAAEANPPGVVVAPLLSTKWSQSSPFNDYSPRYDSSRGGGDGGQTLCGCVATAAAQMFNYFRWPARIDGTYFRDHLLLTPDGGRRSFPIRFDGHVPFDWGEFLDKYEIRDGSGPLSRRLLRGGTPETARHPVARLCLWADVLFDARFNSRETYATYAPAADISEYYTVGQFVDGLEDESIRHDIMSGVPCQMIVFGSDVGTAEESVHQVVVCGWAEDTDASAPVRYAYLNFGWGGVCDGFYNLDEDFVADAPGASFVYGKVKTLVGHYPRAKPQIDPLPKVCPVSVTLRWHFPDFHAKRLSGFTVSLSRLAAGGADERSTFSAGGDMRSLELTGLEDGCAYRATVTPVISGALVEGEESNPIEFSVAEASKCLGLPQIRSVESHGRPIAEGVFHDCGFGGDEFIVSCSESVTELQAHPSHLALVGDDDVLVERIGPGSFRVRICGTSATAENDLSRMILTLAATDANGTTAYRDLPLRLVRRRTAGLRLFR